MDGISAASAVAGVLAQAIKTGGDLAAYISAIKERSRDIKELQDELFMLGDVLGSLRDFLRGESARSKSFDETSVLRQAICDCQARVDRIADRIRIPVKQSKVAKVIDKLRWPFDQKEVVQMIENLRRFTNIFQFALSLEGCNLLSKTSRDASDGLEKMLEMSNKITEMSRQMGLSAEESSKRATQITEILDALPILNQTAEDVREISHAVRLAELREQERLKEEILDWLCPISALHKHQNIQTKRAEGTGNWFLHNPMFRGWVEETQAQRDFLCIGGPGVGKSVLCSSTIDFLRRKYQKDTVAVVFYYIDYAEQKLQTGAHLARCILRQLCASVNALPTIVMEFFQKTRHHVKDQLWFYELKVVLQRVLTTFDKCFLVIDAFDETDPKEQRSGLLEVLELFRNVACVSKVFATTRPHITNIEDKFHEPIRFDVVANEQDMRHHLTKVIDSHPDSEFVMDRQLKEEILDKLCANAHGMFLLPSLQIQQVLDQVTKSDVRRALNELSTDLVSIFASTISRIRNLPTARRNLAFNTLMWLSHVQRPLKMDELQHGLAIRFDEADLNKDNFISTRTILDSCCGLVDLDSETLDVRLVHFSLEEYLQTRDHDLFEQGHAEITKTCLHYISMPGLQRLPFKSRTDFATAMSEFSFLEYACTHWGHHARKVAMTDFQDVAVPVLTKSSTLMLLAKVRDQQGPDHKSWTENVMTWAMSDGAGISIASAFGLTDLARLLISHSQRPVRAAKSMYGSTPLHEAAANGHESTVELLLAHGADILDASSGKATPFYLAVSFGHLSMVTTLLKYDHRQINIMCRDSLTALHKAVDIGSEPMVNLLLEADAGVDVVDVRGQTPLHHAAQRGHFSIAKLLVSFKASINARSSDGSSVLDMAAADGQEEFVLLLLDHGADIHYSNRRRWNSLQRAARNGHSGVVRSLISRGADIFWLDWKGSLAIHQAARSGNIDTVLALLDCNEEDKRRQLSHVDRDGSTAKTVAFYTAHYDVHKYLRAEERRLSGHPEFGSNNDLIAAIEAGSLTQVKALVENMEQALDLEHPNEDGQPPLHVAIQEQQYDIAEYLLATGRCSIHTTGYHDWHPLDIAASLGDERLVDLCLSHGADVHATSTSGQTALHKAASSDSVAVMKRLLLNNADPEARNSKGMTPLHVAANHSNMPGIKLLLREYNADILAQDTYHKTPVHWAERGARLEVLVFLRHEEKRARAAGPSKRRSYRRTLTNLSMDSLSLSRSSSRQETVGEPAEQDLLLE